MLTIELNIDGVPMQLTGKNTVAITIKKDGKAAKKVKATKETDGVSVEKPKKELPPKVVVNTKEELLAYIKENDTTQGVRLGAEITELDDLFADYTDKPANFFFGVKTWNLSRVESMKNFAKGCENFSVGIHNLRVRSSCDFTNFIDGTYVTAGSIAKFLIKIEKLKEKHNDETPIGNIGKPKARKEAPMNPVISQDAIKEVEG